MSFQTTLLTITNPSSTGNQSYTGAGFQPIAAIFYSTQNTGSNSRAGVQMMMGMATDSTHRGVIVGQDTDGSASSTAGRHWDAAKCIDMIDNNNNPQAAADFVSMDSDGITLNWTTANATGWKVYALLIGGSDVTNARVIQYSITTGTGSKSVTGAGFKPDFVLLMDPSSASAPPGSGGTAVVNFGFATSSTSRGTVSIRNNNSVTPSKDERSQTMTKFIQSSNGSGTVDFAADFTSMDSDGFTINATTDASARQQFALCLKGGKYFVGSFNQATTNGSQAVTGVGFTPTGLLMLSTGIATSASVNTTQSSLSVGASDSAKTRASVFSGALAASATTKCDSNNDTTKLLKMFTPVGGGAPTITTVTDITSYDSDGFTINNTTTDATAREIPFIAFGSNPNAPTGYPSWAGSAEVPQEYFEKIGVIPY